MHGPDYLRRPGAASSPPQVPAGRMAPAPIHVHRSGSSSRDELPFKQGLRCLEQPPPSQGRPRYRSAIMVCWLRINPPPPPPQHVSVFLMWTCAVVSATRSAEGVEGTRPQRMATSEASN